MKRAVTGGAGSNSHSDLPPNAKNGGKSSATGEISSPKLSVILASLQAMRDGDFSVRLPGTWTGLEGKVADTFNDIVGANQQLARELKRVGQAVGKKGRTRERISFHETRGSWGEMEVSVNTLMEDLLRPTTEVTRAIAAVAQGNLTQTMQLDVDGRPLEGEFLRSARIVNTMIQQLGVFTAEVTRVAREVGTEGKLGGQARVSGVAGTWKDLTDNVNVMAANLTDQVRGIVKVVTAVANGSLKEKLTVMAKGEVAALAETINNMTDTLATFAEQVSSVAREVGVEGRLGGQANVPGAAGTWKDLTGNVNLLAANLTNQVRAIAEVATAVTKGDLTRAIQVDARGEVAELKDNINAMIRNLRGTTEQNTEQDWVKTNLAKFTRMMQGDRDLVTVGQKLLSELAPLVNAQYGVMYQMDGGDGGAPSLQLLAGYSYHDEAQARREIGLSRGLVGQCAFEKRRMLLTDIPENYIRIGSGLGDAAPRNIIVLPVLFEGEVKAVIELASLAQLTQTHLTFLTQLTESIGIVLNTIEATMRTEGLLEKSQKLAAELQTQQKELQQTNEQLAQKAQQLAEQNAEVEKKNKEIEQARHELEDKAAELALTNRYKSDFLANMSHELRTPLNSILILGQQLGENSERNLTPKQVEFAKTIHAAGGDLLNLISDILDLSKIESGTVAVEPEEFSFVLLRDMVERSFRHEAEAKNLFFRIELDPQLPRTLTTDQKRLHQVLKNLLSNAFKFTVQGQIELRISAAQSGWSSSQVQLNNSPIVIAFSVSDTGIGIASDKQKIIFEAFHQADAGTSRRFGGTGLGLAISRELATLLGGEIRLVSAPGQGSTFTLYLPQSFTGAALVKEKSVPRQLPVALPVPKTEEVPDDRDTLQPGEPCVLIVEDDPHYARVLLGLIRDKGFKGLVTARGNNALALAREHQPTAITLDIFLPDMLGWTVLNHLKQDPATRHIPVQIITMEEERQHGLERGAFAYLVKPLTTEELEAAFDRVIRFTAAKIKRLLVVEDEERERLSIQELLGHDDIAITAVSTGAEALEALHGQAFDCVVLDLRLPDISGFDLLEKIRQEEIFRELPIVVFTGKDLSEDEELQLRKMAKSIVIKGVQSPERLLDETALFLHRVTSQLPEAKQEMLERLHQSDEVLTGKKVLVVDDDVRNIFALTSLLERHSMEVVSADNGRSAIDLVTQDAGIDIVLMDIMMPEMDGYETMRNIRQDPRHRIMPMIALTAKAMKGDREKCLEAGASDYIAKPVNTEQLLSLMRVWLHR